jgi:hypothetical protein
MVFEAYKCKKLKMAVKIDVLFGCLNNEYSDRNTKASLKNIL